MKKAKTCRTCGTVAVWNYAPSGSDQSFCDECIERGCSCWDGEVDADGREFPCIEFEYDRQGWYEDGTHVTRRHFSVRGTLRQWWILLDYQTWNWRAERRQRRRARHIA